MRLGLFGGTFDPIHIGHLILAEACREACALDRVWFVVTASPPHKRGDRTPIAHRLEMARIAVAGNPAFEVSEIEANPGTGPHYSYQTLEQLNAERPDDTLFFIIGADSLADLTGWKRPDRIAELATIVVVNRHDCRASGNPAIPTNIDPSRFTFVNIPAIGISSTDLRANLARGRSVRYQIPRGVEAYIQSHGLYGSSDR